uniref:Uncharacterized protein n=1 Tax=viral metagenome TaxID=1070528 RepID=A0A6C0JDY3_9ZZZZ
MPKRFSNGGNGRSNKEMASKQTLDTGSGLSNHYKYLLADINDRNSFEEFCENIYSLEHADVIAKVLIKQNKYESFFEIFKDSIKQNGIVFTTKLLNNYDKKLKLHKKNNM